jgi:hypothetical protein
MKNNQSIIVGLLAGIAAGLMLMAAFTAGLLAFVLFFAAPAAIYIATMGWGFAAGLIAAAIGTTVAWYAGGMGAAGIGLLLLFFPAAAVGHMVNLGQRADIGNGIVWFPLSDILFRLMGMLAVGFIAIGAAGGYSAESFAPSFSQLMRELANSSPEIQMPSDEVLAERSQFYADLIPTVIPAVWLMFHVIIAFVSAGITRRSGQLARAKEDIAATVTLPPQAILVLVVGLIASLLFTGPVAHVGGVFVGVSITGFGLIGLAELHYRTRPMPARGILLSIVYGSIVLFSVPLLVFTALGIFRSIKKATPGQPGPGTT